MLCGVLWVLEIRVFMIKYSIPEMFRYFYLFAGQDQVEPQRREEEEVAVMMRSG